MARDALSLENIGPIRKADVEFKDLTILVGPQATGKSILLQFFRLLLDTAPIFDTLRKYGLDWRRQKGSGSSAFLELYLGEGTGRQWQPDHSSIRWRGSSMPLEEILRKRIRSDVKEKSFFIPAQRVLALSRDGWFRPFADFRAGDPFVVRDFSEKLRVMMESSLGRAAAIFPQEKRLKVEIRKLLSTHVFRGFNLEVDRSVPQKRLLLTDPGQSTRLPFMLWSAGQREFVPLLLGLYWLLPPTRAPRRGAVEWVIIEELEAGLHPRAIEAMLFIVLDLLWRGYRVCLSTHSAHVLDLVWALHNLRESSAEPRAVLRIFDGVKRTPSTDKLAGAALAKETKVYYFDQSGRTHDISNLDPAATCPEEAQWGGLTEFSGRVADVVAEVVAGRGERE
jgi:hypothetical protein